MGPWTAVAPLMALCTDPHEDIRSRALRLLRQLCEKVSAGLRFVGRQWVGSGKDCALGGEERPLWQPLQAGRFWCSCTLPVTQCGSVSLY